MIILPHTVKRFLIRVPLVRNLFTVCGKMFMTVRNIFTSFGSQPMPVRNIYTLFGTYPNTMRNILTVFGKIWGTFLPYLVRCSRIVGFPQVFSMFFILFEQFCLKKQRKTTDFHDFSGFFFFGRDSPGGWSQPPAKGLGAASSLVAGGSLQPAYSQPTAKGRELLTGCSMFCGNDWLKQVLESLNIATRVSTCFNIIQTQWKCSSCHIIIPNTVEMFLGSTNTVERFLTKVSKYGRKVPHQSNYGNATTDIYGKKGSSKLSKYGRKVPHFIYLFQIR